MRNKEGTNEYNLWQRVANLMLETTFSMFKKEVSVRPKYVFMAFLRRLYPNLGYTNCHREDCDAHWNYASYKHKVVLDLGADYGSTVRYFLKKRARFIIAVEGNPKLAQLLRKKYQNSEKVRCEELMINSAEDIGKLICNEDIDIAKVDIEGAEKFLLSLPSIASIPTWLIETHNKQVDKLLIAYFQEYGFKVFRPPSIGNNKILKAVL